MPPSVRYVPNFRPLLLALAAAGLPVAVLAAEPVAETAPPPVLDADATAKPSLINRPDLQLSASGCPVPRPLRPSAYASRDWSAEDVISDADSSEKADGVQTLIGNVRIRQGNRTIRADEARLSDATERVFATGNISISDPALEMSGATLEADSASGQARITDVQYRLTDRGLRGQAEHIDASRGGVIELHDGSFTSCPVNDEAWWMHAGRLRLDREEGWGEAWDTRIDLGGVPVFYLPYITFPIDERRRSGVLAPDISNSRDNGIDLTVPYYLNLAEHYDATLRPRWIQQRGLMVGSEFRYLGASSYSEFNADLLPDDSDQASGEPTRRWQYALRQQARLSRNLSASVDASGVSDDDYFHDLGSSITLANLQTLPRSARLNYHSDHWQLSAEAYRAQVLHTPVEPYQKLPEIRFRGDYPFWQDGLEFGLAGSATRFAHPLLAEADRVDAAPWLRLPLEWVWGYLTPSAKYRHTEYRLAATGSDAERRIDRSLPVYSVDGGLYFERDITGFRRDWVQTLEPRLYYLYAPYRDQSQLPLFDTTEPTETMGALFRDNRFIGGDRVGDTRQLSVGVSSRFISADGGEERLRLGLAQARYFADRRVGLLASDPVRDQRLSPLYFDAALRVRDDWELRSQLAYDEKARETLRSSFGLSYEPDDRRVVNAEHRYRDYRGETTEQVDFSFAWPVGERWNLVGRWQNDRTKDETLEALFGVEYESCCWALRVVGRRYLNAELDEDGFPRPGGREFDSGIYVQFVFKGLMGVGASNLRTLLTESIQGYQDRLSPR